jgi:hypothetical protein
MVFVNDVPHLLTHKTRTYLKVEKANPFLHSMVFVCNNSYESTLDLASNPLIVNNHKYGAYYMDFLYRRKILNKMININIKKERSVIYKDIVSKKLHPLKPYITLQSVGNKNMFFDMFKYNEYFFNVTKTKTFKIKTNAYIDFLKSIINDARFSEYTNKTVFMELDCWIDKPFQRIKTITFDNPIMILYLMMRKNFDKFKELGDIDFIMYNKQGYQLRLNPSLCNNKSYIVLRKELAKISASLKVLEDENYEMKEEVKQEIFNNVVSSVYDYFRFVGNTSDTGSTSAEEGDYTHEAETPDIGEELDNSIKERINKELDTMDTEGKSSEEVANEVKDTIFKDQLILKKVYDETQENKTGKSTASLKRDMELREKQKDLIIKGTTFQELMDRVDSNVVLEETDLSSKIKTTNHNMLKVRYPDFEKKYNSHLYHKDIMSSVTFLNNKSIPVYVKNVQVEDSSDELNYKETYTFDLEDSNRVRHKLKFDVPKFIDDKFMYLGGNKKIIIKQLFQKPIVKTRPDTVQITTNYNKVFIFRYGDKLTSKIEKLKKALMIPQSNITIKSGNNTANNVKYKSVIEYDELARVFSSLKVNAAELIFNQDLVTKTLLDLKISLKENTMCIGFIGKKEPIIMNTETQKLDKSDMDIVDFILNTDGGKLKVAYDEATVGKKFMYSRAKIMEKFIPVVLLLGFCEGLSTVLRKAEVQNFFTDKRPTLTDSQSSIQFGDGYLVYDKFPIKNSLLMNGLADVPTKTFNYTDFDSKDAYITLFDVMFNSRILANALKNSYDFLIDPITFSVLQELNYPTDFVGLMLFANELLSDNAFMLENNMNLYRVRSNEMVNAYLYKAISRAYLDYELTSHNPNPIKISVPQNKVIKDLLMSPNVEDYSTLNPQSEVEKSRAITPKGPNGLNVSEAYDLSKRSYDKSMLGILSISTSPKKVGALV